MPKQDRGSAWSSGGQDGAGKAVTLHSSIPTGKAENDTRQPLVLLATGVQGQGEGRGQKEDN